MKPQKTGYDLVVDSDRDARAQNWRGKVVVGSGVPTRWVPPIHGSLPIELDDLLRKYRRAEPTEAAGIEPSSSDEPISITETQPVSEAPTNTSPRTADPLFPKNSRRWKRYLRVNGRER